MKWTSSPRIRCRPARSAQKRSPASPTSRPGSRPRTGNKFAQMSRSVNVVNIPNIFREEEPDPQSGPPKGCVSPLRLCFTGRASAKTGLLPGKETNRPDIYGYGGSQTEQRAQVSLRLVNDLHVAHSTGEQNSGDRRNRTLPSHPEQRAYIKDTVGSRQTRAVSRFRKAEPRGSRGPSWARIARPSCAG
jgi:hypothetical protein